MSQAGPGLSLRGAGHGRAGPRWPPTAGPAYLQPVRPHKETITGNQPRGEVDQGQLENLKGGSLTRCPSIGRAPRGCIARSQTDGQIGRLTEHRHLSACSSVSEPRSSPDPPPRAHDRKGCLLPSRRMAAVGVPGKSQALGRRTVSPWHRAGLGSTPTGVLRAEGGRGLGSPHVDSPTRDSPRGRAQRGQDAQHAMA